MQDLGRASGNGFPVTSLWDLHRAHMPVGAQQSVHSGSTLSAEREAEHRGGERQEGNILGSRVGKKPPWLCPSTNCKPQVCPVLHTRSW